MNSKDTIFSLFSAKDWVAFAAQVSAVAASAYYGWKAGKGYGGVAGGIAGALVLPSATNYAARYVLKKTVNPIYLMTPEELDVLQKYSEGQLTQ